MKKLVMFTMMIALLVTMFSGVAMAQPVPFDGSAEVDNFDEEVPLGYIRIEDPNNPGKYIIVPDTTVIDDGKTPQTSSPQTGQWAPVAIIVLAAASGVGAAILLLKAKKKSATAA